MASSLIAILLFIIKHTNAASWLIDDLANSAFSSTSNWGNYEPHDAKWSSNTCWTPATASDQYLQINLGADHVITRSNIV